MIPFAVKQAWFWLALTGLVQCWVTLIYFGKRHGGLWGRIYYCVFVTLLEGMFCIGMVWHMDPSRMPHAFCLGQVVSFSLGSFALTGLCASYALACARAVFRPGTVNTGVAVLAWHPRYIPLVLFFPIVACITHATLLVTLDAVQPRLSDDLHCDATDPMWMRLVGYSGVPMILTIPFLVLSILTAFRLYQVRRIHSVGGTHTLANDGYEDDYGPVDSSTYSPNGPRRRSVLSLSAFLPYPHKARFRKSGVVRTPLDNPFDQGIAGPPLHQHPFPARDPETGNAYSPSLEERDAASFTIATAPQHAAHTQTEIHRPSQLQFTNHSRNPSPNSRSVQDGRRTPDSAISSSMPVFATNPTLQQAEALTTDAMASGSSVRLAQSSEIGETQVGVAITTGESPTPRMSTDATQWTDDHVAVGLAVTTDEPELRTLTPTPRLRTPSPLKLEAHRSSTDADRSDGASKSQQPVFNVAMALHGRARSSENVTHRVSATPHPLHSNRSTPQVSSLIDSSAPQHVRQPSFVSSGTVYSAAFTFPDREDHGLLPFSSPASASTFRSPTTPEKNDIDLAHDLGLRSLMSGDKEDRDRDDEETKNVEWEDDYYDKDLPMRTVKRRDPRERLGIYNPTPPNGPSAAMLARRQNTLRKEMPMERSPKLGNTIWRIILFQIAFFAVQMLASLSSVIDVARNTITPFGTQHVALILAAWGPLCVFASFPRFLKKRRR